MKLVFKKDKDSQISVFQEIKKKEKDFSYVEMITDLIKTKKMENPDISDGFSDEEIKSIRSMVKLINETIDQKEDNTLEGDKAEVEEDDDWEL